MNCPASDIIASCTLVFFFLIVVCILRFLCRMRREWRANLFCSQQISAFLMPRSDRPESDTHTHTFTHIHRYRRRDAALVEWNRFSGRFSTFRAVILSRFFTLCFMFFSPFFFLLFFCISSFVVRSPRFAPSSVCLHHHLVLLLASSTLQFYYYS